LHSRGENGWQISRDRARGLECHMGKMHVLCCGGERESKRAHSERVTNVDK